jgi:hypothetical protein
MLIDDGILKANLKKVWTKYRISKGKYKKSEKPEDLKEQIKNAKSILSLQAQLGYPLAVFPELQ